jgi:hypothetical protein
MAFPQHSQTRYGNCDTFFIQSDDDAYSIAERTRERARAIARVQHRQLGQDLSRLVAAEYQDDILDHMEFMEVSLLLIGNLFAALTPIRRRQYQTSTPSTFKPRSNGTCAHICLIS